MASPTPISANEEQLSQILTGMRLFEVPRYQRGYSWKDDELEDFWRDIGDIYRRTDSDVLFLGAMVFSASSHSPYMYVLDGQQRLTTLLLLVAAMRSLAREHPSLNRFAAMLDHAIAPVLPIENQTKQVNRLTPGKIDRKAFESLLEDGTLPAGSQHESWRLLKRAYDFFLDKLRSLSQDSPETTLQGFYQAICDRVWYIEIICGDQINPQLVFESLNAKGEELSIADLIKNYVFLRIEQHRGLEHVDTAESLWLQMINDLGKDSLVPDYIHAYWNSRYGYSRKENIYSELKSKDSAGGSIRFDCFSFLEDLQSEAQTYAEIRNPSEGFWRSAETARYLRDLNTLNVRIIYSILLALWSEYQAQPNEFRDVVRAMRNFMLRYFKVAGKASNVIDSRLSELAQQVRRKEKGPQDVIDFLREMSPSAEEFMAAFKTLRVSSGPIARLMLADINNELNRLRYGGDSAAMVVDPEKVTLEHVIPQKPNREWQIYMSSRGMDTVDVNLLGNLTLLTPPWNSSASNREFQHKRDNFYEESALPINRSLVFQVVRDPENENIILEEEGPRLTEWGLEELHNRQELFGRVAEGLWRV